MNTLLLDTLTIKNFKGIRDLVLSAHWGNLSIYGENGLGKTTVSDAYYWLLFGKDSLGRKDHEIKTIGDDGEPIHFLDHSVEATFRTSSGETLTLSRTYREDWETQRRSSTKSFKGHTTFYAVNGVPLTFNEYTKRISSICEESQFRLLTDPSAFLSLSWQDRRKMLFDICGDMTDSEVIASTPDLAELGERMQKYSISEFKKVVDSKRSALRDELTALPARIDEAMRSIPSESAVDWESAFNHRSAALLVLQNDRAKLAAGGKGAEIRSKIVDIDNERRFIESELRTKPNPGRESAIKATRELDIRLRDAESKVLWLRESVTSTGRTISSKKRELELKRAYAKAEKSKEYSGAQECPSCGQHLPEDRVQAAVGEFNAAKARRLESIIADGKALAAKVLSLQEEFDRLQNDLLIAEETLSSIRSEGKITIPEDVPVDPSSDPQWVKLGEERANLVKDLQDLEETTNQAIADLDEKIDGVQNSVHEASSGLAAIKQRKSGLVRVEELKAREKELSAQYEELELSIYLCEQFVRAKVRLLTDRINIRFKLTTFRLFKEQINGGLQECCDVLWREKGAQPSHGQAVQIGLDIIGTLSRHIGFSAPVFVDNAESVTAFPVTAGQQVRLYVSQGDKSLRIVKGDSLPVYDDPFLDEINSLPAAEKSLEQALF